ncbi:ubiquitin carboxyl-terminal hydrolase 20 isoform X1 [Danaus plexippus]|uniref:ubiquitin carboxyl-terminal hydrolase 20 isoform X1 n=1 Tax=Danaus plexippus TaxID=13037 RepID=UPI002AB2E142|nr:ubiquitin carboxyl-terminal hydrolase 20 isoform X1 [Danaus plexippus]
MDKGVTCEHLNKLVDFLGKELWQSKESLNCFDCGCPGPNLWICLQPDCHHIGCSEVKNDHSTIHQKNFPSHCVHMNVTTERIWCYLCEKEVHIRTAIAKAKMKPDSTTVEEMLVSRTGSVGISVNSDEDLDPDDMEYEDQRPRVVAGLVGLQNMGNTCYMNAALQALSNTQPLTSYFLECSAAVALLVGDKKPGISRAYQKLIREMWSRKTRGYVVPNGILYGIRNVHPMFRGYQQHDTQEFLRCFMDQLHEELKEPVWDSVSDDKLASEVEGDQETRNIHTRRRAASSGANDAAYFSRLRHSPAASGYTDRNDSYLRVQPQSEHVSKHRRSASFAGTHLAYNIHQTNGPTDSRDVGSESELSSEAEERYETCSSGASEAPDAHENTSPSWSGGGGDGGGGARYRSIISDVFDGKLLSSVQCLICDRVSTRVETFQDLSLPIPSREHLAMLHHTPHTDQDSWLWWLFSWFRSWLYGPAVSLQDCLAAFFSADELKGDNMYSCSRCNKLRNGVKMSGVIRLPEVLCVHLKRFRHELMFSAKVAARVSFPINDLNMAPYCHKECTSSVSRYSLCAVICHAGTAGGGHYTCVARVDDRWYSFDDAAVTPLTTHHLASCEAYVLFYRKINPQMATLRQKAAEILESSNSEPNDIKFYISKQWINKFNTWAEPGPIDNSDFVCVHGGVRPERAPHLPALAARLPQPLWDFLYHQFGGGPAVSHAHECGVCARAQHRLRARRARELTAFAELHAMFQDQERPLAVFAISMAWFRQWQAFVRDKARHPPPPVDNTSIVVKQEIEGIVSYVLKPGSDHAQLSEELWRFFTDIYGGGPEVRLSAPPPPRVTRSSRNYSESDREEYCTKSSSEVNLWLQKNRSLQNISRRYKADSDEEIYRKYKRHPTSYDSDDGMEISPTHSYNTIRMENGLSEHAAPDDLNLDSISLKNTPKTCKVRKTKRRTVK